MSHTEYSDLFSGIKLPPYSELTFPSFSVSFYDFALCVLLPRGLICSKTSVLTIASAFELAWKPIKPYKIAPCYCGRETVSVKAVICLWKKKILLMR